MGMQPEEGMSHMPTDAALLDDIRAGDKNAMNRLVERYKKTAYSLALGLVGNQDDAHDISQEAFLRVYRSAGRFDSSQPFMPWFYTILANLSRSWLRRRQRIDHRTVGIDDVAYLLVSEDSPDAELIHNEQIKALRKALRQLSFEDREIITLQHFRHMSYDQIAELLNIPRGTVMSRLYYARKRLAKLMGEYS